MLHFFILTKSSYSETAELTRETHMPARLRLLTVL